MFTDIIDEISYFLWEHGFKLLVWIIGITVILWGFFAIYNPSKHNFFKNKEIIDNIPIDPIFDEFSDFSQLDDFQRNIVVSKGKFSELWIKPKFHSEEKIEANKEVIIVNKKTGKKQKIIIKNNNDNTIKTKTQITIIDVDTGIEKEVIIKEDNIIEVKSEILNEPEVYRELVIIDLETREQETVIIVYEEDIITNPEPTNPEPTNPEPTNPEPTNPEPTNPEPTNPEPTNPEPTNPEPTNPEPTNPEPTNPEPTNPEPIDEASSWDDEENSSWNSNYYDEEEPIVEENNGTWGLYKVWRR